MPPTPSLPRVESIRSSSRTMVRELGMLGAAHASLGITNSQVHALLELEIYSSLSVVEIASKLRLEKSSTSRLVDDLIRKKLIHVEAHISDGRRKMLSLSPAGKKLVKAIHSQANERVCVALSKLSADEQQKVEMGLRLYAEALVLGRSNDGSKD